MKQLLQLFLLLSFCGLISSCMTISDKAAENKVKSSLIWQQQSDQLISRDELLNKLTKVDVLYLGEAHDNPVHHQFQLEILEYLYAKDKLAGVVMEMLTADKQTKVDQAYGHMNTQAELYSWLNWQQVKGWNWDFYGPMMWLAIKHDIPLRAGNINKKQVMTLYRSSAKPNPQGPYASNVRKVLAKPIQESHCNKIDPNTLVAMVNIQQARDKKLAEEALKSRGGVTVVITGAYHARKDVGSPQFAQWLDPEAKVASVIFVESSSDKESIWYEGSKRWGDWLWLTPKADTERPSCG